MMAEVKKKKASLERNNDMSEKQTRRLEVANKVMTCMLKFSATLLLITILMHVDLT